MNIENIKCDCGTTFEWSPQEDEMDWLNIYRPMRCKTCKDKLVAEREAKEAREAAERELNRQAWIARQKAEVADAVAKATPELFRKTEITHPKFNSPAWAKIAVHELSEEFPWIGFVGSPGRCKTRMAYLYAINEINRLANQGRVSFEFVTSYEIGDAVFRLNGDFAVKAVARRFLDRLRDVDVLLIDDLGKGRLTPAVAAELFALINHRYQHIGRIIWTSNTPPEAIASGLPEDMAGPFIGRINEMSKIFSFK